MLGVEHGGLKWCMKMMHPKSTQINRWCHHHVALLGFVFVGDFFNFLPWDSSPKPPFGSIWENMFGTFSKQRRVANPSLRVVRGNPGTQIGHIKCFPGTVIDLPFGICAIYFDLRLPNFFLTCRMVGIFIGLSLVDSKHLACLREGRLLARFLVVQYLLIIYHQPPNPNISHTINTVDGRNFAPGMYKSS